MKKIIIMLFAIILSFALISCNKDNNESDNQEEEKEELPTEEKAFTEITLGNAKEIYKDAKVITLNGTTAKIDDQNIDEYDYTWHVDPSEAHEDVKNSPAEYYTGSQPSDTNTIYIDHEVYYYPKLDESGFKVVNYDGENEWAYYYQDGTNNDFIFSTLPVFQGAESSIPTYMMHTEEEASANKVLHINVAGTYIIEGTWNGQINIDLGDDAFTDETQKVTLILNGANINCTVAPGILIKNAYEACNTWEDLEEHTKDVIVSNDDVGVNVILADDSQNIVTGNNIYRILKTKYKDAESTDEIKVQKKSFKYDGAFYSTVSINFNGSTNGTGKLAINSSFEGLDSELHLTINGGYIVISSKDDGSNVNEDNVSVFTMNGGVLAINAGLGAEGDGIDSNGFINLNGGTIRVFNVTMPDNALDSENGICYQGGEVYISGVKKELTVGETYQSIDGDMNMGGNMNPFNIDTANFDLDEFKDKVSKLPEDATIYDVFELLGIDLESFEKGQGGNFDPNQNPGEQGGGTPPGGNQGGVTPPGGNQGGETPPGGNQGGGTPPEIPTGN